MLDRAGRERQPLGAESRGELIAALEGCLADVDRLRRYLGVLQEVLNDRARYDDADCLGDKRLLRGIEERGLAALGDAGLTRLALNPVALCALSDHLAESVFTDYWTDVSARAYADQAASQDRGGRAETSDRPARPAGSWSDLVDLGLPALRAAVAGVAATKVGGAVPPAGPAARVRETAQREQGGGPRFRVAAEAAQPDPAETEARGEPDSELVTLAEFTWQGERYQLLADMDDARVFALAPPHATHLLVGQDEPFPLVECKHRGLRLVEGTTRPRIRRRIDAGDPIGFLSSKQIPEPD